MTKYSSESESIIKYLREHPNSPGKKIYEHTLKDSVSSATFKRILKYLRDKKYITSTGNMKSTRYEISAAYQVIYEINPGEYFQKEIDERGGLKSYNYTLISNVLNKIDLFTPDELIHLNTLQEIHGQKISGLSKEEYQDKLETFAIDLSWKSSQIEGNTYSLLDTARLLQENKTADGKTVEEAVMIMNHKAAIDFLIEEPPLTTLSLRAIEESHSILVNGLGIDRNIRKRTVAISGTNYRPIDNEFQIREALEEMCGLVNLRDNVFERALLVLFLISYIQPFMDGNKRTARVIANAMLWGRRHCPISFRTVSPSDYKKAMLVFYEQNNVSAFKKIFIEQFEFAVKNYF